MLKVCFSVKEQYMLMPERVAVIFRRVLTHTSFSKSVKCSASSLSKLCKTFLVEANCYSGLIDTRTHNSSLRGTTHLPPHV